MSEERERPQQGDGDQSPDVFANEDRNFPTFPQDIPMPTQTSEAGSDSPSSGGESSGGEENGAER